MDADNGNRASIMPGDAAWPGQADNAFLIRDPVFLKDNAFHIRLGSRDIPLLHGDQPVRSFIPGWRADFLFTGFAPLFLLELVNEAGSRGIWFLDHRMQMMGNMVQVLPPGLLHTLRVRALPVLQCLMSQVLDRCVPVLDACTAAFLCLDEGTRHAIGGICIDSLVQPPTLYRCSQLMPHSLHYRGDDGIMRAISRDRLADGLAEPWQDRIAGFVRSGRITWPSPVDGTELHAQGSIVFDDFHFAYRLVDPRNGLVFYVVVTGHLSEIAGLWFPALGLFVTGDRTDDALARPVSLWVQPWFVSHTLTWGAFLIPYFREGACRFASVTRGSPGIHLGHQLWNELSGIDRMVRNDPDALPEWIVMNTHSGSELYGPIDAIFPELAGRVTRGIGTHWDLIAHAYANGIVVLRVTAEFVAGSLRDRILGRVRSLPVTRQVVRKRAEARRAPMILFGLRVENRTISDLDVFLFDFVSFFAARHPGGVIVFDGHNTLDGGGMIESNGESLAARPPVEIERELVAGLRSASAHLPVTILDTIGTPVSTSLAWMAGCDGFVSIWGASLAKYRWVCNKPGYVISNQTNLARAALHIYSAPRYMEAPTPCLFVDPRLVTDDRDAAQLVVTNADDPGLLNFRVDHAAVLNEIGAFIDRLQKPSRRSAA